MERYADEADVVIVGSPEGALGSAEAKEVGESPAKDDEERGAAEDLDATQPLTDSQAERVRMLVTAAAAAERPALPSEEDALR